MVQWIPAKTNLGLVEVAAVVTVVVSFVVGSAFRRGSAEYIHGISATATLGMYRRGEQLGSQLDVV